MFKQTLFIAMACVLFYNITPLYAIEGFTGPEFPLASLTYTTAAFGDFNNDGFVDLAVTRSVYTASGYPNEIIIYKNNPANPGTFTQHFIRSHWEFHLAPERQLCWADFDNDGDLDIFANSGASGRPFLYRNSGAPNFIFTLLDGDANSNSDDVLAIASNAQGAGWLDVNRDGWLDLYQSSGGSSNMLYRNNGNPTAAPAGLFSPVVQDVWEINQYNETGVVSAGASQTGNGSYSTIADINNDGRQDILYIIDQDNNPKRFHIWLNVTTDKSATFRFHDVTKLILSDWNPTGVTNVNMMWSSVVTWDADNDGDLDVLFTYSNGFAAPPPNISNMFFENKIGYGQLSWSDANPMAFQKKLQRNTWQGFGDLIAKNAGGAAVGDINNDGWVDVYVVRYGATDDLYFHNRATALTGSRFSRYAGESHGGNANGVTFGDVDNDGDLDMFLCNNGKLYRNATNTSNKPAHPKAPNYAAPSGGNSEHYLDVIVSGAISGAMGFGTVNATKDGIGARVYLYCMGTDTVDTAHNRFNATNLVGMREVDGGSGYGSQASQVQHFGLPTTLPGISGTVPHPHKVNYVVKIVLRDDREFFYFNVIPDREEAEIKKADGSSTWLAQTLNPTKKLKVGRKLR